MRFIMFTLLIYNALELKSWKSNEEKYYTNKAYDFKLHPIIFDS